MNPATEAKIAVRVIPARLPSVHFWPFPNRKQRGKNNKVLEKQKIKCGLRESKKDNIIESKEQSNKVLCTLSLNRERKL